MSHIMLKMKKFNEVKKLSTGKGGSVELTFDLETLSGGCATRLCKLEKCFRGSEQGYTTELLVSNSKGGSIYLTVFAAHMPACGYDFTIWYHPSLTKVYPNSLK